jgi:hypothetical protein
VGNSDLPTVDKLTLADVRRAGDSTAAANVETTPHGEHGAAFGRAEEKIPIPVDRNLWHFGSGIWLPGDYAITK